MGHARLFTVGAVVLFGALLGGCAAALEAPPAAAVDTSYPLLSARVDYLTASAAAPIGLPPGARPGECYVKAVIPAQYETVKDTVLKKAASTRIEVMPAQFQDVEERVLVRPAATRLEAVPPVFEEVEEQVLVKPATTRLEPVAATYRTVTEKKVIRPAYKIWKRSSELSEAERIAQGIPIHEKDVFCLVEIPDEYATVTSQVLDTPAATREIQIPAEYMTVRKTVLKAPATTREIEVPAEYRTVMTRKMVQPERQVVVDVGR
jgi:hypothetical protein